MKTDKKFDAVTQARKWRDALHEKLKHLSPKERIAYLNCNSSMDVLASIPKRRRRRAPSRKKIIA